MPIGDARALLSGLLSKAPGSKRKANAILVSCPDQLAGYVADRLSTALDEDGTKGQAWVDCMRRELDGLLLATGLAKDALEGNTSGAGTTAIGALTISANERCAKKAR